MNGLISWWARNPVAANLLMLAFLAAGLLGYTRIEREVFPAVEVNYIQVSVQWTGASAKEVEEQLVQRYEETIATIDGIEQIDSYSNDGSGFVIIETDVRKDVDLIVDEIQSKVNGLPSVPRDAQPPIVQKIITREQVVRFAVHGDVPEEQLRAQALRLRNSLAQVPGASLVELFGTRDREVTIEISQATLQRYGLSFDQVASAIRASSLTLSGGNLRTPTGALQLRARNLAENEQDFKAIVIRQGADGSVLTLGEIARITDGLRADDKLLATMNGEPAVLINVLSTEQMNVVATSKAVEKWAERERANLPTGMSLTLWEDQSDQYFARIKTVFGNAASGFALVCFILVMFLRPTVAVWTTVGVATAFFGTFAFLPSWDVSLNMISLFAFLLVAGIVVDDAIVVGEAVHEHIERTGETGPRAVAKATKSVAGPVIFAVGTTIIAFAPWMFISGPSQQFTRSISLVVLAALSISLIESLFILPAHLAHMKPVDRAPKGLWGRVLKLQTAVADGMVWTANRLYRPMLAAALRHRYVTVATFVAGFILCIGLVSSARVKSAFMPEVESESVMVEVVLPEGASYQRSLDILEQLKTAQRGLVAEIDQRFGKDAKLIENWYTRAREGNVLAIVEMAPAETRAIPTKEAAERLRALIGEVPDAKEVRVEFTFNDGGAEIGYSLRSTNLDDLVAAAQDLKGHLRSYAGVLDVTDDLDIGAQELQLALKPGAEQLGLTLADVTRQVRQAYFGEEVQRLPRDGEDVRVVVRYPQEARERLDSLQDFRIRTAAGGDVPLVSVAEWSFGPGVTTIRREDRLRVVRINVDVAGDQAGDIRKAVAESFLPEWKRRHSNVEERPGGQSQGEQEFVQELMGLYLMALLGMYALLAVGLRSYIQPLLIMSAIPFGYMGAVLGHWAFGIAFGLFSFLGVGACAGVVVNDNIVLLDRLNTLRREGVPAFEAVIQACVSRFRAIWLTSLTTFFGLMPIMAEGSTQSAFLKPMVLGLAAGVAFCTFLTIFFIPALYLVGRDVKLGFAWIWNGPQRKAQRLAPAE